MKFLLTATFCTLNTFSVCAEDLDHPKVIEVNLAENVTMSFLRISPKSLGINYPDYYVSDTEVTNAQFKAFLDATKKQKDDTEVLEIVKKRSASNAFSTASISYSVEDENTIWRDGNFPKGLEDHPVALITLHDVTDFCQWLSNSNKADGLFRLPSWNEWVIAAYGKDRKYPWGNDWDHKRVHMSFGFDWNARPKRTEPVRARPEGKTPEGLFGMLGNVSEYILTGDPTNKEYFDLGSRFMGGGFDAGWNDYEDVGLPPRKDYWGYSHHATGRQCDLGFRVVLDPARDEELPRRPRLFQQNDESWMIKPENNDEAAPSNR